jgi:hypothetical protein
VRHAYFIIAAIIVILALAIFALHLWANDPQGFSASLRAVVLLAAASFVVVVYSGYIIRLTNDREPGVRFSAGWLVTAMLLVCVAGFYWDAIAVLAATFFAWSIGPLVRRFATLPCVTPRVAASTWILGIVAFAFTIAAAIVYFIAWQNDWMFPRLFSVALWPSAMFAWVFLLGDNARNGAQLVLYGLAFGIPFNLFAGAAIGAILGTLTDMISPNDGMSQ